MNLKKTLAASFAYLTIASVALAVQLTIGAQYQGWNSDITKPYNGWEILAPLSFLFSPDKGWSLYGQGEFASGHYTNSNGETQTVDLNHFSDTILGNRINFKSFGLSSVFNVEFNLPTGDPEWESLQIAASVPTAFVESRYHSRGFGVNVM